MAHKIWFAISILFGFYFKFVNLQCVDLSSSCSINLCNLRSVRNICRKTCNCCSCTTTTSTTTSGTCFDLDPNCPELTTLCNSTLYLQIMIEECPLSCGYCNLTSTTTTTTSITTTTTSPTTTTVGGFAMEALETQTCDSFDVFLLAEDGVMPIFSAASGSMSEPTTCLGTNGDEMGSLFCIRSLPESIAGLLPLPVDGDSLVDVSSITYKSCDNFCACHKDGDCYEDLNMYSGNYKLVPVCEDNAGTKCCMLIYFTSQEDTAGLINIDTGRAYFANATFYSGLSFVRFDCSGTTIPAVNSVSCNGCASIHYPTCQNQQIAFGEERQNPRINKKNRKNGGRNRINNRDRDVNSNKKNRENSGGIESSNDWRKRIFG